MKKAMIFAAAAFTAAAVLNPLTAEAAGANRGMVVYKGNAQEWNGESVEWKDITDCLKWGTIVWKNECPQQPELEVPGEQPNTPQQPENKPESKPDTPQQPENKPESKPDTPQQPENKPESKPDTPQQPENKPESKPDTPQQPENKPEERSFAEQVVDLVNAERGKEGLAPLTIDEKIVDAAAVRAVEIQKSFSHTRPNGSSFSTALKEAGATYLSAGENIAWGQKTPEEVVNAWMNSAGHRANIMNKNYTRIGVAHTRNASGTSYWAQLFAN